jgi:NhaA family Na+:H+ antiporter
LPNGSIIALLPIFFIVIGADVKRELVTGELSTLRTAIFPAAGALGGMLVPVGLFLLIAGNSDAATGWGTVITMDTAFGLSILALFATRLPAAVRALFLAFAAIDDIGGLLVIAFAYSGHLAWEGGLIAGLALGAILALRRLHWVSTPPYIALGALVWAGIFYSGVHATIAGVLLGFTVPVRPRLDRENFSSKVQHRIDQFQEAHSKANEARDDLEFEKAEERAEDRLGYLHEMMRATDRTGERVIVMLTPWISYLVLPLFALSNIRIHFSGDMITAASSSPLSVAIIAGLVIGKPIGFLLFSWAATQIGIARLPQAVTWRMIGAIGCLAGIGFTISLFIAGLAFQDDRIVEQASLAILVASLASGLFGFMALKLVGGGEKKTGRDQDPDGESSPPNA